MTRMSNPWLGLGLAAAKLSMDACAVVGMRMGRLAAGGPAADREARQMFAEKATALVEAQFSLMNALATGKGARWPRHALASYHRRVRANKRRLAKG